ncbi:MAG: ABC transporter substrate-binding protein, partial [Anaerolineae bacterium]|nr:ABC transporter substrate-binding protein [Anaerolineae bacterium]
MSHTPLFRRVLIALLVLASLAGFGVPWAAAQDGGEPRTIVDALGREVTLSAPPQRIVGGSASITEMLYAIGITPAGATEGIDYPPAAALLPTFGTGYQPDLEALAALEPDLIIANAQLQENITDQLSAIAPTIFVMTMTAEDVPANIRLIGQATWHDTSAEYLAQAYDAVLNAYRGATPSEGPSILIIVGMLAQPNFGKSSTYLGHMAALLGATNIADGEVDDGPFPGYAQLSIERVLDEDPDIILTITRGIPGAAPIPEVMAADPVWSSLTAMQTGRVYELDNRLFLESPGPR